MFVYGFIDGYWFYLLMSIDLLMCWLSFENLWKTKSKNDTMLRLQNFFKERYQSNFPHKTDRYYDVWYYVLR